MQLPTTDRIKVRVRFRSGSVCIMKKLHITVVKIEHLLNVRNMGILTFFTAYRPKNTVMRLTKPI